MQLGTEDHDYSCVIFLEFIVNHKFYSKNLTIMVSGRGVVWNLSASYLRKRSRFISLGAIASDTQCVSCGVPQRSVPGPLLFLIYANDFHNFPKLLDFYFLTDDVFFFSAWGHKDAEIP